MKLRIHRFLPATRTEGPGVRACVWVQGCPIRCSGCAVPNTWPEGGEEIDVQDLAERILNGPSVEGVTFAGGEPFAQAEGLAHLGKMLRNRGLSIVTYTGYVLEQIRRSSRTDWHDLLAVTDVLIDGPFRADLRDVSRLWSALPTSASIFSLPAIATGKPDCGVRLTGWRCGSNRTDGSTSMELWIYERLESWFAELARLESGPIPPSKGSGTREQVMGMHKKKSSGKIPFGSYGRSPLSFTGWRFYIGIRARYRRWIWWGVIYSIPFALLMVFSRIRRSEII